MNVLDAKIIHTHYAMETYLDMSNHIRITDLQLSQEERFFEMKIEIEYYRLKPQHYYDRQTNYFWLRMYPELNTVVLLETDRQSLFGVKDKDEQEATKEMIGEWLINTHAFKHAIRQLIKQKKAENVISENEIQETLTTIQFLEEILELKTEDILKANVERYN
ncbi:hypothetical protein [Bacillus sp. B15-48]|uniref:hypothetical protein n=1 Tax=Bacillus sp. B15-48 TaxID=1548601 RepID=UPI00194009AE|nr:hypothetical protein [Bacillus sp. B15-48]MBM4764616.1 hypothetical protein [Bacillus sp. B15-48]